MSQVLRGSRKVERDGKTYWPQVGFTLFISDYQGETRYSVVDERTGERYLFFPLRDRQQGGGGYSDQSDTPF